jgi:hypothetical protein
MLGRLRVKPKFVCYQFSQPIKKGTFPSLLNLPR